MSESKTCGADVVDVFELRPAVECAPDKGRIHHQRLRRVVCADIECDLVAGAYRVDAAVHTRNGRAFDYRRGCIRFVVGSRVHDTGVYRPKHSWKFDGGIDVRAIDTMTKNVPASIAEALRETEKKKKT